MAFNKAEYDNNYKKLHKKQFKVELNIKEAEELNELLSKEGLTKVEFVRKAMKDLKNRVFRRKTK